MDYLEHIRALSEENSARILLIVLDGLGGLPLEGKTELESALKPNLDTLSKDSALGLADPIAPGFTPGSGPAHLSLFGYDPFRYSIGRGILEALGIDLEVGGMDIAVRGNYATLKDGLITDRRAGRISTEENSRITEFLSQRINKIEDTEIILKPGKEHRFVAIFRGSGLYDNLTDADPQKENSEPVLTSALDERSRKACRIINTFIEKAREALYGEPKANYVLLRGFSRYPDIPRMHDIYRLKPACIATYPMYRGLARLVGMSILDTGTTLSDEIDTLRENFSRYDFFFLHIKKTDSYGEDGNFAEKIKVIESFDRSLPDIIKMGFDVIAITGDHSTPALMKSHSWHPNPLLIHSRFEFRDNLPFDEKNCRKGSLGRISSVSILPLLMANSSKLKKYGA